MLSHIRIRCLLTATALLVTSPALACSVVNDYRVPTNLELVGKTPLILVGVVESGRAMPEDVESEPSIRIRPIAALKGDAPGEAFEVEGVGLADDRFAVLSNPYEFEGAHPLTYIGGCIRYMFPVGTTALFFLEQREGKWASTGDAFSRWAEDVPSPDAPWPRLVSIYVRAMQMPEGERRAFLEGERARLAMAQGDPIARLMALDIARQLAGPNKTWNRIMSEGTFGSDEASVDAMVALVEEASASEAAAAKAANEAAEAAERAAKQRKRQ